MTAVSTLTVASTPFVILHGGTGLDITLLEYLFRVVLHLLGFGGVAGIALWGMDAARTVRSGVAETWGDGKNDR